MNEGDTFRRSVGSHLWVVVSDPRQDPIQVAIVSLTTLRRFSDHSCLLQAGEHSFIKHETCLMYSEARIVTESSLEGELSRGQIQLLSPVTKPILDRIRHGAAISDRIPLNVRELLRKQRLFPLEE